MSNTEERREDKREPQKSVLSVQIVFASTAPTLLGKRIAGSTVDISPNGLGILLDCEIPDDCMLDLWVTMKDDPKKYFLSGKVRWCRPADEEGMFTVGISMYERHDTETDLNEWKKVLNE